MTNSSSRPITPLQKLLLTVGGAIALVLLLATFSMTQANEQPTSTAKETNTMSDYRKLTPAEERVIVNKGTEMPFTGEYDKTFAPGVYHCRRCNAPLYNSDSKFNSGCGWPAFDDEIPGAVKRIPDADGRRTEIVCANCGGHLGHVFTGEHLTDKNTRHCVNSVSMIFVPEGQEKTNDDKKTAGTAEAKTQRAVFAGGCYWGVEYYLQQEPGVISTTVGYAGGDKANPTYKEVCYDNTGHAESVEVVFNPEKTSFEKLARVFFEIHDPTEVNRQGPDVGDQYRSVVFYLNDEQKATTEKLIGELKDKGYKVVTQVQPLEKFYGETDEHHQDYYRKNGKTPYCHVRVKRF